MKVPPPVPRIQDFLDEGKCSKNHDEDGGYGRPAGVEPISFSEKLEKHIQRDQNQAKNLDKYKQMVKMMSVAENKEELGQATMLFMLDMSYDRGDICLALHTVECAKGWH